MMEKKETVIEVSTHRSDTQINLTLSADIFGFPFAARKFASHRVFDSGQFAEVATAIEASVLTYVSGRH